MDLASSNTLYLFLLLGFITIFIIFFFISRSLDKLNETLKEERRIFVSSISETEKILRDVQMKLAHVVEAKKASTAASYAQNQSAAPSAIPGSTPVSALGSISGSAPTPATLGQPKLVSLTDPLKVYEPITSSARENSKNPAASLSAGSLSIDKKVSQPKLVSDGDDMFLALNQKNNSSPQTSNIKRKNESLELKL